MEEKRPAFGLEFHAPIVEPDALPRGEEDERPSDVKAPFSSLAFKIMTDPFVGKLTYLRVYSGQLDSGSYVSNASNGK